MKRFLLNTMLWGVMIIGVYTINMHAMEEVPLNNDQNNKQEPVSKEEPENTKEITLQQTTYPVGWSIYLKEWYQGPFNVLMQHLLDPKNNKINLNEPNEKYHPINNLFQPALNQIRSSGNFSNFKSCVESIKKSNIIITDLQKDQLMKCYELLIETQKKTISLVAEEIKKQNHEQEVRYHYIQNIMVPLFEQLKKQVDQSKNHLNKKEEYHKEMYNKTILPVAQTLSYLLDRSVLLNSECADKYYATIGFYPQVSNQITQLEDRLSRLNELERVMKMPLISPLEK